MHGSSENTNREVESGIVKSFINSKELTLFIEEGILIIYAQIRTRTDFYKTCFASKLAFRSVRVHIIAKLACSNSIVR